METRSTIMDSAILKEKRMSRRKGGIGRVIMARQDRTSIGVPTFSIDTLFIVVEPISRPLATFLLLFAFVSAGPRKFILSLIATCQNSVKTTIYTL